jgi:antitoxin (DNA-binding transcriptional repressor) of toxin-antitoxin stability system
MKTDSIPFTEARTHLSKYGQLAENGQTTLVYKHHRLAFLIAPPSRARQAKPKAPGQVRGQIHMAPDFDATPAEVIAAFEGTT